MRSGAPAGRRVNGRGIDLDSREDSRTSCGRRGTGCPRACPHGPSLSPRNRSVEPIYGRCPLSSKPVSRRSPSVGRFDSCTAPLRRKGAPSRLFTGGRGFADTSLNAAERRWKPLSGGDDFPTSSPQPPVSATKKRSWPQSTADHVMGWRRRAPSDTPAHGVTPRMPCCSVSRWHPSRAARARANAASSVSVRFADARGRIKVASGGSSGATS
jgi:hypothetical protein